MGGGFGLGREKRWGLLLGLATLVGGEAEEERDIEVHAAGELTDVISPLQLQ